MSGTERDAPVDDPGDEWVIEEGVRCVVAPCCAFTFDAGHTDTEGGGYSCPACAEIRLLADLAALRAERESLREAILDIDAHATPFGEDEHGFVTGGYLISVGSLHRALGVVGHTAPKCSPERRCLPCARHAIEVDRLRSALTSARDFIHFHPAVAGEWPVLVGLIESALARVSTEETT